MMRKEDLMDPEMEMFFSLLDMYEITPEEDAPGYTIRWFRPKRGKGGKKPDIHLVSGPRTPELELAHFCVIFTEHVFSGQETMMRLCRESKWLERDSGSGRIWMKGPGGIRVEVRPR